MDVCGEEPLRFKIFTSDKEIVVSKKRKRSRVQVKTQSPCVLRHMLYVIVPELRMGPIPRVAWTQDPPRDSVWRDPMWHAGYCFMTTNAMHYGKHILGMDPQSTDDVPLFGVAVNSLTAAVSCLSEDDIQPFEVEALTHFVACVVLQYYVTARGLWLRVRTDAAFDGFDESLPPYLLMLHRELYNGSFVDQVSSMRLKKLSGLDLERHALENPFAVFFWDVCLLIAHSEPCLKRPMSQLLETQLSDSFLNLCKKFRTAKLLQNWSQTMATMRFREVVPVNVLERVQESMIHAGISVQSPAELSKHVELRNVKWFARPAQILMRTLKCGSALGKRLPLLYCHLFFTPNSPLLRVESNPDIAPKERRTRMQWQLWLFAPVVTMNVRARVEEWPLPKTALEQFFTYDGVIPLCPVRARYTFFVNSNGSDAGATLYIPNQFAPAQNFPIVVPLVDETSTLHISSLAREWLEARGTARTAFTQPVLHARIAEMIVNPEKHLAVSANRWLRKRAPLSVGASWLIFLGLRLLFQSEEDALATVTVASGCSLDQIQESERALTDASLERLCLHLDTSFGAQEGVALSELLNSWDRCSVVFPPDTLSAGMSQAWNLLAPPAVVQFNKQSWIQGASSSALVCGMISTLNYSMNRALRTNKMVKVLRNLNAVEHSLTAHELTQLQLIARFTNHQPLCRLIESQSTAALLPPVRALFIRPELCNQ
jgi:hypothetical protein